MLESEHALKLCDVVRIQNGIESTDEIRETPRGCNRVKYRTGIISEIRHEEDVDLYLRGSNGTSVLNVPRWKLTRIAQPALTDDDHAVMAEISAQAAESDE